MATGTIQSWNAKTGRGRIVADDTLEEIYFDWSQLHGADLARGARVSFEECEGRDEKYARDVRRINGAGAVIVDAKPID
jgi:cold shock CspA family protein